MAEIGTALRSARRNQGLDIDVFEAQTKIRARHLQALEEERFELLHERAYARAFLRTYAGALGLDPTPLLEAFDARFPEERPFNERSGSSAGSRGPF